eukprot:TRINITY_DN12090_c0_g5_i1.p1 TRINITY_DN12090_c0_g5~~TRINITY_DN12090_c0_g5_i1.p1  ORF type:complete len:1083 (+),score=438.04 TRINITY_DN12090_c0_g5_i1:61-3309(+)
MAKKKGGNKNANANVSAALTPEQEAAIAEKNAKRTPLQTQVGDLVNKALGSAEDAVAARLNLAELAKKEGCKILVDLCGWKTEEESYTALGKLELMVLSTEQEVRIAALNTQNALAANIGPLFEPYALTMLPRLVSEEGSLCHKQRPVREAADELLQTIVAKMNPHALRLALPALFDGANMRKWETQFSAIKAFQNLGETKPVAVARCLQEIMPVVSDQMTCSKAQVAEQATNSMKTICSVSGNNDLAPFVDQIITSVVSPDDVSTCVHGLASTVFVQKVQAPALALVEPLLMRGLKVRKIAMQRKVATIVDNMTKLIDNPGEATPFLERVKPALLRAEDELTDAEAKSVVGRAVKELDMAEREMADFKALDAEKVLAIFQRECCFIDVVDLDDVLMEYISGMCSALIANRVFNEEEWAEAVVPYMSSFTEKAEEIMKLVLTACTKESKPPTSQADVEEEGEDLCNCEFTLGYAAKILLSNTRLHLKRGKRYGLCGPNDCGKSTLMRSIANGQLEGFPPSDELKTVYLEHDIQGASKDVAVLDYVFLDPMCAHCDRDEVKEVLTRVGFAPHDVDKGASQNMHITALSGGWKMKLALARAMLAQADIMLLDEPTNHLDVDNVAWVKDYLLSLDTVTSIIVSHDSKFMDDVCTHIIHFEERKLKTYIGNLAAFVEKVPSASSYYAFKTERLKFIFPKPTSLEGIKSKGRPIMSMTNVSFTYPGATKQVLKDVSVKCTLNSRIAVIGPNGAGKSTAIKVLTGENLPCAGQTWKHPQMRFAYVAQHAFHHLEKHLDKTPAEYILWRYQAGFDKELAERGGTVITPEEQVKMDKPIVLKVEDNGKMVEKKFVVERFCSRRKKKTTYEYETKFRGLTHDSNLWLTREKLEDFGFRKLLTLCDEEENSRMGVSRPLTNKFVLEQLAELGLETEYAGHVQISNLSGGQKVKVVLAAAMWGSPHLIILDEPTNYLDRDSLAALAGAIKEFEGGVLLISHNRDFVEHVCKTLWIMANGKLRAEGEEDLDEKIEEDTNQEDTIDHLGNTVKNTKKKELSAQAIKKEKKRIQKKIKSGEELNEDEENFCIEYDL